MKIPRTFKLKGKTWKVSYAKHLVDDHGNECDGMCYKQERQIVLRKNLEENYRTLVFLHEFFHSAMRELHVDLDAGLEEVIVDGLSSVLLEEFELTKK